MEFGRSFHALVLAGPPANRPRLTEWLTLLSDEELQELSLLIRRCEFNVADELQHTDRMNLVWLHNARENSTRLEPQDQEGWINAYDDLCYWMRKEQYTRLGVDHEVMRAVFGG